MESNDTDLDDEVCSDEELDGILQDQGPLIEAALSQLATEGFWSHVTDAGTLEALISANKTLVSVRVCDRDGDERFSSRTGIEFRPGPGGQPTAMLPVAMGLLQLLEQQREHDER